MVVFDQRVEHGCSITPARRQYRQFSFERNEFFEDQSQRLRINQNAGSGAWWIRRTAGRQREPCFLYFVLRLDDILPFAVVAEPPSLEHCRETDAINGGGQIGDGVHLQEWRRPDVELLEEGLLCKSILRRFECGQWGVQGYTFSHSLRGENRNVLELVSHKIEAVGKSVECIIVGVVAYHVVAEMLSRSVRGRIEESKTQTERITGQRQHAPELAAPKNSDIHVASRGSG